MKSKPTLYAWPLALAALFLAFILFSGWSIHAAGTRVSPVVEDYGQNSSAGRSLNKPI
ncbi:hypothetical protein [Geoalkalibacter halelectricus]|uniref:Uncharacterized protein n=1 Tax=Geoalkalibacter halelectricus TaxID=2847045 RepID=A0ABY5ZU48_9BACT|nr:hypothetical protein [Geoalkalibacter halelectricus]MDO3377504.1 hypothetical protein [Geoalkalibacter halelectricus]UWZ80736.1 hypothetical protein L9S41_04875 [Geoalkalibacter halelectricus]